MKKRLSRKVDNVTHTEMSARQLGQSLRKMRKKKGISAKFVSVSLGISPQLLSAMESGERNWNPGRVKAYKKAIGL